MACEAFVQTNFQARTLDVIEQANVIIDEYAAQGFTMTLRQLYYQASSPDLRAVPRPLLRPYRQQFAERAVQGGKALRRPF